MNMKDTVKNDKNLQRDIENMSAKYRQIFIEKLIKYSEVKTSSKTITIGGDKIPCRLITASVDEDALAKIIKDVVDYANGDDSLEKLLLRVASNGAYRDDPDEYVDKFFDELDNLEDSIDKIEDSGIEINFDFYITKSGRRLAQLDFDAEIGTKEYEASLILGKNVAKSKEISFEYEEKNGEAYSIEYTVKEDSAKLYQAEIEIEETTVRRSKTTTKESKIKIEWDKRSGEFSLKSKDYKDRESGVKGTLNKKGDRYIFVLEKLTSRGKAVSTVKSLELTVTIDRHDPTPNVPGNFTEITKMDERDFKRFSNDLNDGFQDLWKDYFK